MTGSKALFTWTVTYDEADPDLCCEGGPFEADASDRGFIIQGWGKLSTSDAPTGPAFRAWCDEWGPVEWTGGLRDLLDAIREYGGREESGAGSWYSDDSEQDYRTGVYTSTALHVEGVSDRNLARIRALIKGGVN